MTEMLGKVERQNGWSLRPREGLLHRIVDNLIEVHSMPSDFVSVIQPTAAKSSEGTGAETPGDGLLRYCQCGTPFYFPMLCYRLLWGGRARSS